MKRSSMYLLLIVIGAMILLLWSQEEYDVTIVTAPKIHSYYYSDKTETITIDVLTNHTEHYYFDDSYITNCSIQNEDTVLPFQLMDISVDSTIYSYLEQDFYPLQFHLKPDLTATNQLVTIPHAMLVLSYENGEMIELEIGELNYLFYETLDEDITLSNLSATTQSEMGYPTVSGINLSITNRSSDPIVIEAINVVSDSVLFNTTMIKYREACERTVAVADCLWIDEYYPFSVPTITPLQKTFMANTTLDIYIPLTYQTIPHIEQFAIDITYQYHGSTRHFVIDDFPFLQTSPFQPNYESEYMVYVFSDYAS